MCVAGTEPPTKDRRALAAAVTACFAERPVWSLPELQHRLADPPDAAQVRLLQLPQGMRAVAVV